jgi:hypothetical protein
VVSVLSVKTIDFRTNLRKVRWSRGWEAGPLFFQDDPAVMERAIEYLVAHGHG